MNNAGEAIRVFEDALKSTFSEFDFKRDPGEEGLFPRIYRRASIGDVGLFVDVCINREGFSPVFPGQLPPDPKLEGWFGVYLVKQPKLGKRFRLFCSKGPSELTLQKGVDLNQTIHDLIMTWNYDKIVQEKHKFDDDYIDV